MGAALISGAPMIQYAIRFPDEYNARVNQIGIIQSGWLANEQVVRHEGAIPILIDQLQRSALAFNAYPDRTSWYGNPGPLFDFAWGALFLLGLGYATLHLFNRRLFPMTAWWWGAMIMGGVLTESPPSSQRLVTMGPPAVFMVALALVQGAQIARAAWPGLTRRQLAPALGAAVLILALLSIKWYFVDFTPLRVYGNFDAVTATALGEYAHTSLGPDWRLYFFGPPRMFVDFPTVPYLAPEVEGKNIEQPVTPVTAERLVLPDKNAAFVFLPERRNELSIVRQQYPNGAVTEIPAPNGGDPLLIIYQVPRDQLGQGS